VSGTLHLEGVGHSVLDGGVQKPVLARITRSFDEGTFHVVSGPSGAGKTTLLSLIAQFLPPTSGTISLGEMTLTGMGVDAAAAWRRASLGMIFQTSRLIRVLTVAEHIEIASRIRRSKEARAEGHKLLNELGMGDKLAHRPHQLSGGEKQRVALAQALCARPTLLLADEPTAALDQGNAELVGRMLVRFARENCAVVVCISHDRTVIDMADESIFLERA